MTYCVGLLLDKGIVFMSDTRTNAGVDNVSTYRKMFTWSKPGERVFTMLAAGNLATTQTLVSLLDERTKAPGERKPSILEAPTMFQVASIVGETLREVIESASPNGQNADSSFGATVILGGQVAPGDQRLFLIYPQGNFIEATPDTRFFQAGETKYGRPILVRAIDPAMSFEDAVKLLMVSFDSTIKANLSVGLPIDLQIYTRNSFESGIERRFETNDPYYQAISSGWGEALKKALDALPDYQI